MSSNIDVIEYENYEKVVKKYDQLKLQNLKALGRSDSSIRSGSSNIQTSDFCKRQ